MTVEFQDYYKTLGVPKDASDDQIKKAYRKLARKYHPDVNKGAECEANFKRVTEAYEVLKEPEKRKVYDQYGADWKTGPQQEEQRRQYQQQRASRSQNQHFGGAGQDFGGFDFGGGFEEAGEYSDFFESIFGGQRGHGGQRAQAFQQDGADVNAAINISLEDAFNGTTRTITFDEPKMQPDGRVTYEHVTMNVKIPKGIKQGQKIRLAGKGQPGMNGGEPGDLFVQIDFEKHRHFRVKGADLHLELPLAPWEAALGTKVDVPVAGGKVKLTIPSGTKQGKKFRLKGKGIPSKQPGDLYVKISIVLPPAENEHFRKIYEEMKQHHFDPRAGYYDN